jgi:hypothetical protein
MNNYINNIEFVSLFLKKQIEHVESIKSFKIIPLNHTIIKGIIQLNINENEYIADKLIHGDLIGFLKKLFFNYIIEVIWI